MQRNDHPQRTVVRIYDPTRMLRLAMLIFECALIGYIIDGWAGARYGTAIILGIVVVISFAEAAVNPPPGGSE